MRKNILFFAIFAIFTAKILPAQDPAECAPVSYTVRLPHAFSTFGQLIATVPSDTQHLTLCGLAVCKNPPSFDNCEPFQFMFSDGPAQTVYPDFVAGHFGYPTGTVVSGTITVATTLVCNVSAWDHSGTNIPQGYSVVSTCPTTSICTISIPGGSSVTTSGVFDVLLRTGTSGASSISLTATGYVSVAVAALTPLEFFGNVLGWLNPTAIGANVPTNAAYISVDWSVTSNSNVVVVREDVFGVVTTWTNSTLNQSRYGCIKRGSQLRIQTAAFGGLNTTTNTGETITYFGWRPVYTPAPLSDLWHTGNEINLRAVYNAKGYGQ
jgi:hypothetical protein